MLPMQKKPLETDEADARTRTGDPFITSEVLYQLSYVGRTPSLAGFRGHGIRANQSSESAAAPSPSSPAASTNAYVASSFPGSRESSEPTSEYAPRSASAL